MCVLGNSAHAACVNGRTVACVTVNGSAGTRECVGGRFTGCIADFDSGDRPCQTACGTTGYEFNGRCKTAEVCNSCDDDGDGAIDEGLKCASWPLQSHCPATDVTVGAVKLTTDELVGVRSSDNVLDRFGNEVANLDGNHAYGDTVISPAAVVWAFAPPDCAKSTTVTFTN